MEIHAYLQHFVGALHRDYGRALVDLGDEQFYHRPSATTNHIAFTAWHLPKAAQGHGHAARGSVCAASLRRDLADTRTAGPARHRRLTPGGVA